VRQHGRIGDSVPEVDCGDDDRGDWGWNRRIPRRISVGVVRWRERQKEIPWGMVGVVGRRGGLG
jgi:hypothetical protein